MITTTKPLALALALGFFAAPAHASETNAAAFLSVEEAIAIALEAQPGTIGEAELDQFEGRPAYDIEVVNEAGQEIEFKVDAETGEILNKWIDDDPTDDPVSTAAADPDDVGTELEIVAASPDFAMNGVTVTKGGRVFVSLPQWTASKSPSVAEILKDGSIRPYPGNSWNEFDLAEPMDRFMNVNAVHSDGAGSLWVVDYAGPDFGPSIDGAQKLVRIDLGTNEVARVYRFDDDVLPESARLNDVRVDAQRGTAYISEFGVGAIIVVDLESGAAFRALDRHYSTRAHPDVMTTFLGKPFRTDFLQVNDIELSADGETLYFQPTGGPILWKIETRHLAEPAENAALEQHIKVAGKSMTIGGMTRNDDGLLYLGSVQDNAVWTMDPDTGDKKRLVQDDRLLWPDAMSVGADGYLYIPAPQLRLLPKLNDGADLTRGDFAVYRVKLAETDR
ncbi:MAG: L-dopachrome tautomerase-related protein [Pseudomonadota bacterium]